MIPETVRHRVLRELGSSPEEVKLSDNVFEIERNAGTPIVVKILDHTVTPRESTLSELEWLGYLQTCEVYAIRPLDAELEESIHEVSGPFYYILYHKAEGSHADKTDGSVWNSQLFIKWGEAMGKLHLYAQSYKAVHQRPHWQENMLFRQELLGTDPLLSQKWKDYRQAFNALGTSSEEFGLIHGDLHPHNFLLSNGKLTLIDFGDSEYHWYDYDIAIAVYHMAQTIPEGAGRRRAVFAFYEAFMKGYRSANPRTACVDRINYFIDYRHLYSYTYHCVYSDPGTLNEAQTAYLDQMRQTLEAGGPCLGFTLM